MGTVVKSNADGVGECFEPNSSASVAERAGQAYWEIASGVRDLGEKAKELRDKLDHGARAWDEGEDACAMAECDPSDQYLIGEELEGLEHELAARMPAFARAACERIASAGESDDVGDFAREAARLAVGDRAEIFERMSWESEPEAVRAMACEELGRFEEAKSLHEAVRLRHEAERSERAKLGAGARARRK